ncbi:MAG TPA: 23S rRNA (adenine(2503)-C(2))-methyltransferase RlmN [Crocinitomicaceae bacterium]|nr:23S rRNA (adenine(2503)-C(2))-methyltransferase RlmN [Crocinitomicaceae bacterium]
MSTKINIRNLSLAELKTSLQEVGEKAFRGKQIYEWLWQKDASSFEDMTNLSKSLREKLEETYYIDHITLKDQQISLDKTIKCAFEVDKNQIVEGVLIPTPKRTTACISSQIGCSLACEFCATGKLKLMRNLSAGEIVDQVVYLRDEAKTRYDKSLSNIVYMGMGEPLLNYKNMLRSIELITSEEGLGMSPKRITVSTAGIAKMIKKLGDDEVKFNLALSLHAANDKKRSQIMEINDSNNLEELREALQYFHEKTGTRITFEYIIFKDFNDSLEDAQELAQFAKCVPCKINIIEYNPIDDGIFQKTTKERTDAFAKYLEDRNMIVHVRRSRGKDIDAACGQLVNKNGAILKEERKMKG